MSFWSMFGERPEIVLLSQSGVKFQYQFWKQKGFQNIIALSPEEAHMASAATGTHPHREHTAPVESLGSSDCDGTSSLPFPRRACGTSLSSAHPMDDFHTCNGDAKKHPDWVCHTCWTTPCVCGTRREFTV